MTRQEEKQQLRAIVRRLEAALTPEYKAKSNRAIVRRLLAMPEFQEAGTVFCFAGTAHEIDTRPWGGYDKGKKARGGDLRCPPNVWPAC